MEIGDSKDGLKTTLNHKSIVGPNEKKNEEATIVLVVTIKSKAPKKVTFKEKRPQGKGTPRLAKGGEI
jgi:hypothetical protein